MKNTTKPKNKKTIKELASYFDQELQATLPITVLPNGVLAYKQFVIKQLPNGNWGLYHINSKDLIEQFFLKSCALMAAKAYNFANLPKYFEIKRLDNRYWASYCDSVVFKHNIKLAKDYDKYLVLLNRLEYSTEQAKHYKAIISQMFRWSFV